jgi:hypothetical protein
MADYHFLSRTSYDPYDKEGYGWWGDHDGNCDWKSLPIAHGGNLDTQSRARFEAMKWARVVQLMDETCFGYSDLYGTRASWEMMHWDQAKFDFDLSYFRHVECAAKSKSSFSLCLHVCSALKGNLLGKVSVARDASMSEINVAICVATGIPPVLMHVVVGAEGLCNESPTSQPFLEASLASGPITVSLIKRCGPFPKFILLQALLEMEAIGEKLIEQNVVEIVGFSKTVPFYALKVLKSFHAKHPSGSLAVACMVAANGSEIEARTSIEIFMVTEETRIGYETEHNRTRHLHTGCHGMYREWLRRCGFGGRTSRAACCPGNLHPIACSTWLLSRTGFTGLLAIMDAFDDHLQLAGGCQKALLLLCAAWMLPWLRMKESEVAICTTWFTALLQHTCAEVRVSALICLQRIHARSKVLAVESIGAMLKDKVSAVRHAAIVVLGGFGRRATPVKEALLAQLSDASPSIRYASLVALGGLQASARSDVHRIAELLQDDFDDCRLAALRALRCIGAPTSVYLAAITERMSKAPELPLPRLFRGWNPLGTRIGQAYATFADPATSDLVKREMFCCKPVEAKLREARHKIRKLKKLGFPVSKNRAKKNLRLKEQERAAIALIARSHE